MNKVTQLMHVWDGDKQAIVQKSVTFVPSLYKIFDEILVNAADNKQRDSSMDTVRIDINQDEGSIAVWNNGETVHHGWQLNLCMQMIGHSPSLWGNSQRFEMPASACAVFIHAPPLSCWIHLAFPCSLCSFAGRGIPVTMHKDHGVYVPELIFGHLLTSSNYDDSERKVTGGRNGYGAKLANIFSNEFIVETMDSERGLHYRQVFQKNMQDKGTPEINKVKKSGKKGTSADFTCITFKPDLKRFKMDRLDDDVVSLFQKRAYDIAGVTDRSVRVFLNGEKLEVRDFKGYVDLFMDNDDLPRLYDQCNDRWEVCVSLSDGQFEQVSFVNSICTYKGG